MRLVIRIKGKRNKKCRRTMERSANNNSNDYDKKFLKIKFNPNDDLHLKKTLELHNIIIVVVSVFHNTNKYYLRIFLDECLYKLA